MKHKITFFAVLMMALVVPQSVKAYDFSAEAPTGQTLYYTINGSNVTVTSELSSSPYYNTYPTGELTIPSTVTFRGTTYTVTGISEYAFSNCSGLTSVTIPESVTSIGSRAFDFCTSLLSVIIPGSVHSIGSCAFNECHSLTSITMPEGTTTINYATFRRCYSLTSITIPSSISYIDIHAFVNDTNLTTVFFNATNCTSIGSFNYPSFDDCPKINTLIFGENVTNIPSNAFLGCLGVTSLIFNSSTPPTCQANCFGDIPTDATVYVPCGSYDAYYNNSSFYRFTNIQETGCSPAGATIRAEGNNIVVDGAAGNTVTLYDNGSNVLDTSTAQNGTPLRFENLASGTYYVKIGILPAKMKVVVE